MTAKRFTVRILAGLTIVAGLAGQSLAQAPAAADLLARKPIQPNVKYSTPTPAEAAACKVETIDYPQGANGTKPTGYIVRDGQSRIVRQFVDTTGKNSPNIVSYFLDGVEAYREIDTNVNGKPDTFRYLGANGGRLGRDAGETGTIDSWEANAGLTAEEASHELFTAIATRDAKRFQSLLVSDAEVAAIGLPATEEARVKARRDAAGKRFADTVTKLSLPTTAKWVHLETALPHTVPFDAFNGKADSVRHKSASMLVDRGDNKVDLVACGEMILVGNGRMWKLIDGPGDMVDEQGGGAIPAELKDLVQELSNIQPPAAAGPAGMIKNQMDRAAVLEKIVAKTQGAGQEPWLKQLIDAYQAAGEQDAAGSAASQRLAQWKTQIEKAAPGTPIHAYAAFRHLTVEYSMKIRTSAKPDDVTKTQAWWKESLEGYLKTFPTAEDAPDAMLRLAMAHEFSGKDSDAIAVCEKLTQSFPQHAFAVKATGIVNRLKSDGQPLVLAGPRLGTNQQENVAKYAGQVVLVVYWASWAGNTVGDAKQLVELEKKFAGKLVIVTVNLDDKAETATQAVTASGMPGIHIFQPGGIDANPLAVRYGIMGPHAFLIGKDGKVANKNVQLPLVGDEIERLSK